MRQKPSDSVTSSTNGERKHGLEFKDAMTLVMSLSHRGHSAWSAYFASAFLVAGWIVTRTTPLTRSERVLIIIAVVLGVSLNMFATLAIYRYFNAVIEETKVAAGHVLFWDEPNMREAIGDLKAIKPVTVIVVNLGVAALVLGAALLVR
jgi:preprotein translocase subunit Sec61beta